MTVTLYCRFTVTQFYFQATASGPLLLSFQPPFSSVAHMVPPQLPGTTLTFFSLSAQLLSTVPSLSHLDSALHQCSHPPHTPFSFYLICPAKPLLWADPALLCAWQLPMAREIHVTGLIAFFLLVPSQTSHRQALHAAQRSCISESLLFSSPRPSYLLRSIPAHPHLAEIPSNSDPQ